MIFYDFMISGSPVTPIEPWDSESSPPSLWSTTDHRFYSSSVSYWYPLNLLAYVQLTFYVRTGFMSTLKSFSIPQSYLA